MLVLISVNAYGTAGTTTSYQQKYICECQIIKLDWALHTTTNCLIAVFALHLPAEYVVGISAL